MASSQAGGARVSDRLPGAPGDGNLLARAAAAALHHCAVRRPSRHPGRARVHILIRGGHTTGAGCELAAARLVQCKIAEGRHPLILSEPAALSPYEREDIQRLGRNFLAEWTGEAACGEL